MDVNLTDRIRERAYYLWLADGCCEGGAEQHWLVAEREILQSVKTAPAPAPETSNAAAPAKRAVAKPAAKKVNRPSGRATPKPVAPSLN